MGAFGGIQNMITQLANNNSMRRPRKSKDNTSAALKGMYIKEKELAEEEWLEIRGRIRADAARRRRKERILLLAGVALFIAIVWMAGRL